MNIGYYLIVLATGACLTSTYCYLMATRGKQNFSAIARLSYSYLTVLAFLACGLLFYYFISGDYSYKYVFDYSSSDLPLFYLISAFWAGQQGTYLLWLALSVIFGYYIIKRCREYTNYAMFFYGIINLFFCVMLLVLSPFEKLPIPQSEGAGLNPLLIDPWMVIHPPVIFVGYAATAVLFAIFLSSMIKNKYDNWVRLIFPPAALVAVMLAAGNILGGFWAYKTLGWGGYWAWDPVENSSFIPWIVSLALIHGLLIERKDGALRKTNLFLAAITFLLVVYGTFLTRSGVLADFSVHSFVDLGVNNLLIGFMSGAVLLALVVFAWRFTSIKGPPIDFSATSRQFALLLSVWTLSLIALIVLTGTSWPLITGLFGTAGSADTDVYGRVTFPLVVIMGLFLGLSPFLKFGGLSLKKLLLKMVPSIIGAVIITIVSYYWGVSTFSYLLYVFMVSLALISNSVILIKISPIKLINSGAQISHFGLTLMLLGILGSSVYSISEKIVINRGETGSILGMEIEYNGLSSHRTDPQNEVLLNVNDGESEYEARPRIYWSQRSKGLMKKPHVKRYLMYDMYFAPEQVQEMSGQNGAILVRDEAIPIGSYSVTFKEFDSPSHTSGEAMQFGAKLLVQDSLGKSETITPFITYGSNQIPDYADVPLMEGLESHMVRLEQIYADQGAVRISVVGLTKKESEDRLIMEVSKKPAMNILWAGSIILIIGGLFSFNRRYMKSKKQ